MPGPNPSRPIRSQREATLLLLLAVAVGTLIRSWRLGSQIPFDDEWHAMAFALDEPFSTLLTHYTRMGANSVPHNLYLRLVAWTVGLSEWSIVLPSLVTGVLLLWCYGRWVSRRFGDRAALLATLVLALSPLVIFYSRFARPYAPLLLLEFLAIARLADWLRTQAHRDRRASVIFGVLAIWVHVSALPAIAAAWGTALVLQWRADKRAEADGLRPGAITKAGAVLLLLAGPPTLYWRATEMNPDTGTIGQFSWQTLLVPLQLLLGTSWWLAQLLFAALAVAGFVLAMRRAAKEVLLFGAAALACVLAVLGLHPWGAEVGAIAARYALPLFLLPALAIGVAGQALADAMASAGRKRAAWVVVCLGIPAAAYLSGPLPRTLAGTNSFTKHPTFLLDLAVHDPKQLPPDPFAVADTPGIYQSMLQPFYARLAHEPGVAPIIEYPFLLGRNYNVLYFAQQLHRRPVLAGYWHSGAQDQDVYGLAMGPRAAAGEEQRRRGYILDAMMIDHVLGRDQNDRHARFATVVDILDQEAVRRSGAEYLVLHGNLMREFFLGGPERIRSYFVGRLLGPLSERYGPPIVDNEFISVFRLSPPAQRH